MALRNVWSQKTNSPVGLRFESLEKQFVAFCFFFHTVSLDCVHCVCDRGVRQTMGKPYKPQMQQFVAFFFFNLCHWTVFTVFVTGESGGL